jgi:hypothetical protein
MPDVLQTAAEWLGDMFQAHASETITYCRGSTRLEFDATCDKPRELREKAKGNAEGFADVMHSDRDFTFPIEEMASLSQPQNGDRIERATGEIFEVLPIAEEKAWRKCDALGKYVRVHCKFVGIAT